MKTSNINVAAVVWVLVILLGYNKAAVQVSMAVVCNPSELSPCSSVISSSAPPSKLCCSKLQEQKPCLCQYATNIPNFNKFLASPNAQKVATTCGVPIPKC